jgi:hypothetical protein
MTGPAKKWEGQLNAQLAAKIRHVGRWEDDAGSPGPLPDGNGRAAFPVPRLLAPRFRAGDTVTVELPGRGPKLDRWTCEIFGVQLALAPADPATVRVRALELEADAKASRGRAPCPTCGRPNSVLADGTMRAHPGIRAAGGMRRGDCLGSGKPAPGRAVSLETLRKGGKGSGVS